MGDSFFEDEDGFPAVRVAKAKNKYDPSDPFCRLKEKKKESPKKNVPKIEIFNSEEKKITCPIEKLDEDFSLERKRKILILEESSQESSSNNQSPPKIQTPLKKFLQD